MIPNLNNASNINFSSDIFIHELSKLAGFEMVVTLGNSIGVLDVEGRLISEKKIGFCDSCTASISMTWR